ncbi:hypothetical protein PCC7424_5465 (plasmid) [Gloeothece citriformis PCC 7424]|uniref:Uncharacterized protein n=1 Tax=Gloeothece citriformis (strain PCC 7424) TaxID=65393 RepID=B7KLS1_GLOC7|nr:hypothetical protein [Gloeothece citriformis]ACK73743.1 hypothetical protein PCC7424_5676 [Gloeothece citriformis PCC 7424]ACK74036.1 hypothetical protein PCC7424_5465 [Gloeothece citriformis PCC 7424]
MTISTIATSRTTRITEKLKDISLKQWFFLSWCSLILNIGGALVRTGSIGAVGLLGFSIWVLLALFAVYIGDHPTRRIAKLQKVLHKYGFFPFAWLLTFVVLFFDKLALPTMAQTTGGNNGFFFNNIKTKAEAFLNTNTNASGAVPIMNFGFAVLQVLMLLYIGWSIVKVVQAVREDEDWKAAAKAPLIVLFACTAGDFAVSLV